MSTRGCIARLTNRHPIRFRGAYHHWDSYPSGLGQTLFQLWRTHFKRDTEAMLRVLIDDHPAGWSTINGTDFNRSPGWDNPGQSNRARNRPQCYCHGGRHEKGWMVTEANAAASGVEYVYAFDGSRMLILGSFHDDGTKMLGMFGSGDPEASWAVIAEVALDGVEPDWDRLDYRSAAMCLDLSQVEVDIGLV